MFKKREREREMTEIKEIMHKLMNRLGFFVYNSTRKMWMIDSIILFVFVTVAVP